MGIFPHPNLKRVVCRSSGPTRKDGLVFNSSGSINFGWNGNLGGGSEETVQMFRVTELLPVIIEEAK